MLTRSILERILGVLAVGSAAPGCAARAVPGDAEDAGLSTSSGGSVSHAESGQEEPDATTDGEDGDAEHEHGDEPRLDVASPALDVNAESCDIDLVGNPAFECEAPPDVELHYFCTQPDPGATCDELDEWNVAWQARKCVGAECFGWGYWQTGCGHDPSVADACCYWIHYAYDQFCPGRPFVVDGQERLAGVQERQDWAITVHPCLEGLDDRARAGLAAMWIEHARFEHASVASFARFVLHLLTVGAPAELIERAQQAACDELAHARAMFGLASAYAGRALGPAELDVDGSLDAGATLEAITLAAVDEGCIAETISALHVADVARQAGDPTVAALLREIAEQELAHAELAWGFVRWALERGGPALRHAVEGAFADAARKVPRCPTPPTGIEDDLLRRHGLLSPERHAALARAAVVEIIRPAAARLLARRDSASVGPTSAEIGP